MANSVINVFICMCLLVEGGLCQWDMIKNLAYSIKCLRYECCKEPWIKSDIDGLSKALNKDLHGQHLATDVIVRSLRGHRRDDNPAKALVLSMHGWTGGGKNYVSRYVADHLFLQGYDNSIFVHMFVATLHFPHISHVQHYKDQLTGWIKGNVSICPHSLFIFDEMDKMPPGLMDSIKPFMDHYHQLEGVDYRKTTFLFLSNSGGNDITKMAKAHWDEGRKREDIKLKDMEDVIKRGAYNEDGGLWHADLITKHLITSFVPFLPMERTHVKACIRDDLRRKNLTITETIVDRVADELQYFPSDAMLYSTSGCKRVPEKVNFIMEDY